MAQNELKRLSKVELLEMLLVQSKRVEELEKQVEELQARLDDRTIMVEETGDLASACFRINGMFEAAQATVNQYMENVYLICERRKKEAEREAFRIVEQAKEEAMELPKRYFRKGDGSDEGPEQE